MLLAYFNDPGKGGYKMGENHPLILCGVHFLFSSLTLLECLFSPLLPADQITRFIVVVIPPPTHTHFDLSMSIFSVFRFWPDVYNVEWARIALSGKGWKTKYSTELWNGSLSITSIQCAHTGVWRLRTHTDTGCGMSISVETSCCHIQRNRSFKELYLRQMLTEAMLTK